MAAPPEPLTPGSEGLRREFRDFERVLKRMWDTILAGGEWRGEFLNKKKNGEQFWELASISPIKDAAGTITHYLAVKEDITERKRMEETLRQERAALQQQNNVMLNREERVIELKHEVNALLEEFNRSARYTV